MAQREDEKKPKNTKAVEDSLKGDTFPTDWGIFLDDDIRAFFDELFEKTDQKKSDVIRKANLSRTFAYQLMDGKRLGNRDYYLNIALAMSLDMKTTQRMLAVTHSGGLHPLIKRDAAVMFAINHRYSIEQTYDFMEKLGVPPLKTGAEDE